MIRYCLLCFVFSLGAITGVDAQEKELKISQNGVSTDLSKQDVQKATDSIADSIIFKRSESVLDSLQRIKNLLEGERVYSQKQWKKMYDSLLRIPGTNIPGLPGDLKKPVSEEDLLQALNEKFNVPSVDKMSVPDINSKTATDLVDKNVAEASAYSEELKSKVDVNTLKLPDEKLDALPPLPANIVDSKYLDGLDSIRSIKLSEEQLKLKEMEIAPDVKMSDFSEKPKFWDKAYFEGVVGFTPGDFKIFQASPALGYHFTTNLSLGLGPNILVQKVDDKVMSTFGAKTFIKSEFFKRRVYAQVEDLMGGYGAKQSDDKTDTQKKFFQQHSVFVGGGFLLDVHLPFTLNFSALYCVTKNEVVTHQFSPMVLRIGLSSLKLKK